MNRICLLVISSILLRVSAPLLLGDDLTGVLAELYGAVNEEIASKHRLFSNRDDPQQATLLQHMNNTRTNVLAENSTAEESVRGLKGFSTSEKVQRLCDHLVEEIKKSREAKENAYVVEADTAIQRVGEAVLKAGNDRDLDPVLHELARVREKRPRPTLTPSVLVERMSNKLMAASSFVTQWQDYLAAKSAGNDELARTKLNSLANNQTFPIVPRSEILARAQALGPSAASAPARTEAPIPEDIVDRIQTLDEIPAALQQLRSIKNSNIRVDPELVALLSWIVSTHEAFKVGLPVDLPVERLSYPSRNRVPKLMSQLLLTVLPRFLGATEPKPEPTETVDAYLERAGSIAKKESNWPLLLRTCEAKHFLAPNSNGLVELGPLRLFIQAQNQEIAGQYAPAVASYQGALRDITGSVPVQLVGQRLQAIKKEHPKDYEQGSRTSINPTGSTSVRPLRLPRSAQPSSDEQENLSIRAADVSRRPKSARE